MTVEQRYAALYVRSRRLADLVDRARRWGWADCADPLPAPADLFDVSSTRPCGECPQCEWHRDAARVLAEPAHPFASPPSPLGGVGDAPGLADPHPCPTGATTQGEQP